MSDHLPVVLTAEDFALLERLSLQCDEPFASAADIARRKLDTATVVFPADVPANVVTLNSRVRFRIDAIPADERILVGTSSEEVYGLTLLLASPRGLALIGAAAGQTVQARRRDGTFERLHIDAVLYQPEQKRTRPVLQVISGRQRAEPAKVAASGTSRYPVTRSGSDDDPGPSAA